MANKSKHMKEESKKNKLKIAEKKEDRKGAVKKAAQNKKNKRKSKNNQDNEKFNFDNEIVIGVNVIPDVKKDKLSKTKKEKSKNSKKIKNKKVGNKVQENTNRKKDYKKNNNNGPKTKSQDKKQLPKQLKTENEKNTSKVNKRKINVKRIIKLILIIAVIIGIIVFILTTPIFNITQIDVNGNSRVTKERIESLSQITLNTNTYQYSKSSIINSIKEEPYIENVNIKRKLPNKIEIEVTERTPSYIIESVGNFIYVSNQGYILEISNQTLNIPIIIGFSTNQENLIPGNRLCDEDLEKLNTVLKIVEAAQVNDFADKITSIDISDSSDYIIKLEKERKTAYLGDASNINDRILMLKEILTKESENAGEVFIKNLNKIYFRQEE